MQINSVTLTGRLGRDPEVVHFESGAASAKFSIAVDKPQKDAQPDWFECVAWGKTGEVIGGYCRKGSMVGVTGSVYLETWEDKTSGQTRSKRVINVQNVALLSSKPEGDSSGATSSPAGVNNYDYDDF